MLSWECLVVDVSDEVRGLKKGSARSDAIQLLERKLSLGFYCDSDTIQEKADEDEHEDVALGDAEIAEKFGMVRSLLSVRKTVSRDSVTVRI
jgi:hypothetical protein